MSAMGRKRTVCFGWKADLADRVQNGLLISISKVAYEHSAKVVACETIIEDELPPVVHNRETLTGLLVGHPEIPKVLLIEAPVFETPTRVGLNGPTDCLVSF